MTVGNTNVKHTRLDPEQLKTFEVMRDEGETDAELLRRALRALADDVGA